MDQVLVQGERETEQRRYWTVVAVLALVLLASYLNTLWAVSEAWDTPQYQHGWLIPPFAAFLIWARRRPFVPARAWEQWAGVGLIAAGTLMRVVGAFYVQFTLDNVSFIPCLLGIFLLVGGVSALKWAGPGILFLIFMYPLPGFLVDRILRPLQTLATMTSVYALQTLGVEVFREGNVIHLEKAQMGVVDQCSGLRMLTIFMALSVALALIWNYRPLWERIGIFLSSIPIALLVNTIRITLTGVSKDLMGRYGVHSEIVDTVSHDLAGWVMMPMAFGFLWLVSWILARVVIEEEVPAGHDVGGELGVGSLHRV